MLEIRNLTCGYDSKFFLKDINFVANSKEFIGIIGPNGSGKTTLLRAITRVINPIKGEILFDGKNIRQMGYKNLAKKIAVVSQGSAVNSMTVEEFILLGRIPHFMRYQFLETGKDMEFARNCMEITSTLKLKDQLMCEISGGERQLAFVARALCQRPKLLLLDEPTSHLDIAHQVRILDLVKRLNKKEGLTVIIILHDLNLASQYCDRLLLLDNGRIYKTGFPEDVLTYQIIEEVYKTVVVIQNNPISLKPYVLLVPEEERQKRENKCKQKG